MVDMGGEAAAVPSLSRVPRLSFIPWLRLFHSLTHSGLSGSSSAPRLEMAAAGSRAASLATFLLFSH